MDFANAQYINEIFPNPTGSDNNKEFVEIYGDINLSRYIIGDANSNDTLTELQHIESNYSIIVEDGFDYISVNASVYSAGATIGNNLGNSEDTIYLFNYNGTLIDSFFYDNAIEGYSIELNEGEWFVSKVENGTAGYENSIASFAEDGNKSNKEDNSLVNSVSVKTIMSEELYVNQEYNKGFRIDNKGKDKIDVTLIYSVFFNNSLIINQTKKFENISRYRTKDTINLLFDKAGNYTLCGEVSSNAYENNLSDNTACMNLTVVDLSKVSCDRDISIELENVFYKNNEKIKFKPIIKGDYDDAPFVYSYSIEELGGNIVKNIMNSTNTNQKIWTPKLKKRYGVYMIKIQLLETTCEDTDPANNYVNDYIIIQNRLEEDSSVSIEHIYLGTDGIVRMGEAVSVRVQYYTGNLSRLAGDEKKIKVFVKDKKGNKISDTTEIKLDEIFIEGEIVIPVLLDYSCSEFPIIEEDASLVVQGLGSSAKMSFPVQGVKKGLCKTEGNGGEYNSITFAEKGYINDIVTSQITIHNINTESHTYKISSKIYRGPKTYSGDLFDNLKKIELKPGEEKKISLNNNLTNMEAGDYKIKIQIQKDDYKTIKEFREDISVFGFSDLVNKENHPIITSFTSTSDEIDEEVLLYSIIDGKGNYTLILDTPNTRENRSVIINGTEKFVFNASLANGKNNFVLSLLEEDTIVATKPLILFAENYEINDVTSSDTVIEPKNSGFGKITGNVVGPAVSYEGSFYKIKDMLNYFLIALLLLFVIILLFRKA